jgi:hypothetical protein
MRYDPVLNQYKGFFNSIGDTINNLTINTHNTEGNPFNQPVMIISTADKGTDMLVRAAAQSAGYPSDMINTDVIPSATVNMGLEGNVDLFCLLSRNCAGPFWSGTKTSRQPKYLLMLPCLKGLMLSRAG